MYIRRYYPKGIELKQTYSDNYFEQMVEKYGINKALLIDNANYEIIFETRDERDEYMENMYERIKANPRFYLTNLENIPTISYSQKIYDRNVNCFTTTGVRVVKWD